NEKNTNSIKGVTEYSSYKEIIDKKKDLLNMDIDSNIISKLYDVLKLLCETYSAYDKNKNDCTIFSEKDQKFVDKCNEHNNISSILETSTSQNSEQSVQNSAQSSESSSKVTSPISSIYSLFGFRKKLKKIKKKMDH
ncbi:Plasmodium variant antigen protein Cir/Yir/Bir, putative, partial [Plasmodium berghei]